MGEFPVNVTFYGTRGSTPCAGEGFERYGGQTSCVVVEHAGDPIIFDLGTGMRRYGCTVEDPSIEPYRGTVLLTHTHWDHVQGLPFFGPLFNSKSHLDIYGAGDCGFSFEELIPDFMKQPFFPITPEQLPASIEFHNLDNEDIGIDAVKVRARPVPHTAKTSGYRIELHGVSIAYVPDHQEPIGRPDFVDEHVLELCDGVDLLIHDSQFTPELLAERASWGHCTIDYALTVAQQAGVSRLALFHHDPTHDDDTVDRLAAEAAEKMAETSSIEVFAAATGQTVGLGLP